MSEFDPQEIKTLRLDRRLRRALGGAYQRALRPRLPLEGFVRYSGVIVADRRAGDRLAPKHFAPELTQDIPDYEAALMQGLSAAARSGDTVVVVGGGLGVTVAHAARLVGEGGRVVCYEGSPECTRHVRRTAALNGVAGRVRVEWATVGAEIGVYLGSTERAAPVTPAQALPDCDVLELDCEGAEILILSDMTIRPRTLLVETHGHLGAPALVVRGLIEGLGYRVEDLGVAEPRLAPLCEANDVRVLRGERG
jgi:hypothetical protein